MERHPLRLTRLRVALIGSGVPNSFSVPDLGVAVNAKNDRFGLLAAARRVR